MFKICIDPGHGGKDPGAVNGALYEKDVVLEVGLLLEKLLVEGGYDVVMTRRTDVYQAPAAKALTANNSKANYLISIHCNAAESKNAHGTEVLVYNADAEEGKLGRSIQESLVKALGTADRGVKERKDLVVLNSTSMTAVLVEIVFISNEEEKAILLNEEKLKDIAKAIFDGLEGYLKLLDLSIDEVKALVKEKYGFDDNTMLYLEMYRYGDSLLRRIAEI